MTNESGFGRKVEKSTIYEDLTGMSRQKKTKGQKKGKDKQTCVLYHIKIIQGYCKRIAQSFTDKRYGKCILFWPKSRNIGHIRGFDRDVSTQKTKGQKKGKYKQTCVLSAD